MDCPVLLPSYKYDLCFHRSVQQATLLTSVIPSDRAGAERLSGVEESRKCLLRHAASGSSIRNGCISQRNLEGCLLKRLKGRPSPIAPAPNPGRGDTQAFYQGTASAVPVDATSLYPRPAEANATKGEDKSTFLRSACCPALLSLLIIRLFLSLHARSPGRAATSTSFVSGHRLQSFR